MKSAIITGATGFIGSYLVNLLLENRIKVLALGRRSWSEIDQEKLSDHQDLTYLKLDMEKIEDLPNQIENVNWEPSSDCVFYNFAWWGKSSLSDLEITYQLQNVTWAAYALTAAKNVGCKLFVHVGTMEEAFTKKYLELDYHTHSEYNRHVVYSVAKMTSRNIVKLLSAEEGIDLVVTTNSHVMGPCDDKDSFLQVTLQKLMSGDDLIFSTGEQYFDVISVHDCARAYKLIGESGRHGEEYWIGSGEARPLKEYVIEMAERYPSGKELQFGKYKYNDISLTKDDFSIEKLVRDTGFKPAKSFKDIVEELYEHLSSNK